MRKILIIGIDGATFDIIEPFAKEGKLPLFKKLMKEGCYGNLKSVVPALTPPGWTSGFTGVNPGKHNIYDFFSFDRTNKNLKLVSSKDRKYPSFWEILSKEGIKTGVFNIPCSYPVDEVNGFMVSGMATPEEGENYCHPQEIKKILNSNGKYRFGAYSHFLEKGEIEKFLLDIYKITENEEDKALTLIKNFDPDVFFFVYDEVDRIMHFFWHDFDKTHPLHNFQSNFKDAILKYYQRIEKGIEKFVDAFGNKCDIIIFSDHGFGPLLKDVYVNYLLYKWGFLEVNSYAKEYLKKAPWKRFLKNVIPSNLRSLFRKKIKSSPLANPLGFINFEKSKAFYSSVSGRSVIILDEKNRDNIAKDLKEKLESYIDKELNLKPFEKVFLREEIYIGEYVKNAPDILIKENGKYAFKSEWSNCDLKISTQYGAVKSGSHRENGILIFYGESFEKGQKIEEASLIDVTPTILYLLSLPIGKEMDGKVLSQYIKNKREKKTKNYKDFRLKKSFCAEEDEEAIKEKLKNLGYM